MTAREFLDLHRPGDPLLMPNPWDAGSARILEKAGFRALATTSSGFAATLGRADGSVTRDEALAHTAAIAAAVAVPVNADLENCFADSPDGVADTVRRAITAGAAGVSVEDFTGDEDEPIYEHALAADRVRAAVEAADDAIVVTGRAENLLHGVDGEAGLADAIARLQAYAEAGAHVLYAPGLTSLDQVRRVLAAVDRPVNVLTMPGLPGVAELAEAGVARISVGGSMAFASYAALGDAADSLRQGRYDWLSAVPAGRDLIAGLESVEGGS